MKILLVGEAANHRNQLANWLEIPCEILTVPFPADGDVSFAALADTVDVVVSLRIPHLAQPARQFRLLQVPGAGLDGINFTSLPETAWVCNVFEHEIPIAEYVLMAMIHWATGFDAMRQAFSFDNWATAYRQRKPHQEIAGKTLGLLGLGHIGKAIAKRARAFGMRIVAVQRSPVDLEGPTDAVLPLDRLHEMLQQSDFLVIACPLTEETRGIIGKAELEAMPNSSVLINVSRAEIVQEQPLYDALLARRIAGAYLDVWYRYPIGENPNAKPSSMHFDRLPNVVCTPHSSAWTDGIFERRYRFIAGNITRLHTGKPLENVVRMPNRERLSR